MGRVRLLSVGLGIVLLVGCGGMPNAPATQTRTAEIVELTVSARLLPTQNAAVPPTPVPVPSPSVAPVAVLATPTHVQAAATPYPWDVPVASPAQATTNAIAYGGTGPPDFSNFAPNDGPLLSGSWVAFSPALHVRLFAPPSLVDDPQFNNDHRYSLGSPSNVYDFEALDIYRFVGAKGGDFARTWQAEMDTFRKGSNVGPLSVTDGPRQQQVGAYQGNAGQFHYSQQDNDLQISGTIWVGQVGGDEAIIIYRCTPEREGQLDGEFAQIIATIDFGAQ